MPFSTLCLRPADASIVTYTKAPSKSIKSLLRRQLFKKSSSVSKNRASLTRPLQSQQELSRKPSHTKRSKLMREVNTHLEHTPQMDLTNNYDMTVFHDDELDDTETALSHRQSKRIPRWARKSQLQMAIINQIYYNDKDPEDIFGTVRVDLAREMVASIELWNTELPFVYSSNLPPNFV